MFANTQRKREFGAENLNLSCHELVLGVPCQTAVEGGGRRHTQCDGGCGVLCLQTQGGEGIGNWKPKTEHNSLVLGAFRLHTIFGGVVELQHTLQ